MDKHLKRLDSRSPIGVEDKLHGNDKIVHISTFYETVLTDTGREFPVFHHNS